MEALAMIESHLACLQSRQGQSQEPDRSVSHRHHQIDMTSHLWVEHCWHAAPKLPALRSTKMALPRLWPTDQSALGI